MTYGKGKNGAKPNSFYDRVTGGKKQKPSSKSIAVEAVEVLIMKEEADISLKAVMGKVDEIQEAGGEGKLGGRSSIKKQVKTIIAIRVFSGRAK